MKQNHDAEELNSKQFPRLIQRILSTALHAFALTEGKEKGKE